VIVALFLWLAQTPGPIAFKDDSPAARMRASLKQHLAAFPGDLNAIRVLATYELEANHSADDALALLKGAKESSAAIERLRALAHRKGAESIYQRLDAWSATKYALRARFRFVAGRYPEAFAFYRRALKLDPDFPQAHAAIAEIYRRTGHPDWAAIEERLEKGLPAENSYQLAVDHLNAEQKAIDELMHYAECWEKLDVQARVAGERGERKAALEFARKALALAPDNPSLERQYALALFHDKQYTAALPLLEKHRMSERSIAHLELGQPGKAVGIAVLNDEIEDAKLQGLIHIQLNTPMQALPKLQALAGYDIDGSLHEILGRAYQALHQPNPAGLALMRATRLKKRYLAELEIVAPTK
jgi:tetratricopeptide (TPR) repeat protein